MALTPAERLRNLVAVSAASPSNEHPTCERCQFFDAAPEADTCRRHAPQPGIDVQGYWQWPNVEAQDWCGEWRSI